MMRQDFSFSTVTGKMLMLLLFGVVAWHVTGSNAMAVRSLQERPTTNPLSDSHFPNNLFREIAETESGDFVCSPISASMVLSMAALGARSATKEQLSSALGIPINNDPTEYLSQVQSMIDTFQTYDQVDLRLAHKMFLHDRFRLKENFASAAKDIFRSEARTLDFGDVSAARTAINEWCSDVTNERLTDVIKADDLNSKTSIVLVNVAYFLGQWASPFSAYQTEPRDFWLDGNTLERVLTMYKFGSFRYGELPEVDAKFVELPYKSKSERDAISMFVILPNARNGLAKLKKNFDKVTLDKLRGGTKRDVHVYLPRFTVESAINLAAPLNQLGVIDMFDRKADFKGISDGRQLRVSKIMQKSAINVAEGGTEAVAANLVFESDDITTPDPDSTVDFKVNHPFICTIVTKTGVTLFTAVISSSEGFQTVPNSHFGHPAS